MHQTWDPNTFFYGMNYKNRMQPPQVITLSVENTSDELSDVTVFDLSKNIEHVKMRSSSFTELCKNLIQKGLIIQTIEIFNIGHNKQAQSLYFTLGSHNKTIEEKKYLFGDGMNNMVSIPTALIVDATDYHLNYEFNSASVITMQMLPKSNYDVKITVTEKFEQQRPNKSTESKETVSEVINMEKSTMFSTEVSFVIPSMLPHQQLLMENGWQWRTFFDKQTDPKGTHKMNLGRIESRFETALEMAEDNSNRLKEIQASVASSEKFCNVILEIIKAKANVVTGNNFKYKNYYFDTEFLEGPQKNMFGETRPIMDVISIGMVCEDGRTYYAICNEFNLKEAWNRYETYTVPVVHADSGTEHQSKPKKNYWIRENILKPIFLDYIGGDHKEHLCPFTYSNFKKIIKAYGKSKREIANDICVFVFGHTKSVSMIELEECTKYHLRPEFPRPIFYAYYADYDWMAFCSLFGKMINLPKDFPMYCRDVKQILDEKLEGKSAGLMGLTPDKDNLTDKLAMIKTLPEYPVNKKEHHALYDAIFDKDLHEFIKTKL